MKNKLIAMFIGTAFVLISCKNKSDTDFSIKEGTGKKIILPSPELMRNGSEEHINPLSKKIKIFTIIDGSCPICVDKLIAWKTYMKAIDTSQVGFVFLIHSEDSLFTFKELNKQYIKFSYPYFHDVKKNISSKNNLLDSKLANTFLVNNKNEIILAGDPTKSKKIFNQYSLEINKRITINKPTLVVEKDVNVINKRNTINKPTLVVEEGVNETKFKISEGFIYKDQSGKILEEAEWSKMMLDNKYVPYIDSDIGVITFKTR